MKHILLLLVLLTSPILSHAQSDSQISSIDFVVVVNNHHAEALYYYQNNWKALRSNALKKGYIAKYQLLEIEPSDVTPYNFILITTYANQKQYNARENNFESLIQASGGLKLLNTLQPKDFRQVVHGQDTVVNH